MTFDIDKMISVIKQAGELIMQVYQCPFTVDYKSDNSPVTQADQQAHDYLCQTLNTLTPNCPIISEESPQASQQAAEKYVKYWLIDPLDGTREFIRHNNEFTVNIALIEAQKVVWGCIYAPAFQQTWWGGYSIGAWTQAADETPIPIHVLEGVNIQEESLHILTSRSYQQGVLQHPFLKSLDNFTTQTMGSSLKFCQVAQGLAHLYIRPGTTYGWDTAAGQAIVEGAGGVVLTWDNQPLRYQKPNQENPAFIVSCLQLTL